jgi:hypothetical protein
MLSHEPDVGVLQQPVHPFGRVASPPAAHREHALAHSPCHRDRAIALAGQKYNPRPPYDLLRRVAVLDQSLKPSSLDRITAIDRNRRTGNEIGRWACQGEPDRRSTMFLKLTLN